ncbi:PAS domain S-box protein [Deinococcus apachensis]|uniref:PAS domain S-box protein n=1 Tax=Deinococcus apachensis TaxID=309886 RepID=UPI00037F709D|nr:PAS domain S-box protein [Deinococcus apachensis]
MDRSLAFCPHAILTGDVLVVPDAALDRRFAHNPLVTGGPFLRFYAGAPLLTPGGQVLGTLCVMDIVPRAPLTPGECDTLCELAAGVVSELELRRSLRERRRSDALRDAVLTSALDAVIIIDGRGRVEEWNPAAGRLFGYSREEALGRELGELIIPEHHRSRHRERLAQYVRTGEGPAPGRRLEVTTLRRGGGEFPCELTITPFRLGDESLFTIYLRDLTEPKAAQEALRTSENLLRAVVESVPASIFVKDLAGRYLMINGAGAAQIGRPVEEILGRDDEALFPAVTARASRQRDAQVLLNGETLTYETTDLLPDGTSASFLSTKGVYRDGQGQIRGVIGTVRDITRHKAAEALIHEQNAALEALVHRRTQEVEEAQLEVLDRLARAAELRDDATGEHLRRVARTAAGLARHLGLEEEVTLIERAAPLHDVGKIGVPDAVLLKPGRLTREEFSLVQAHTRLGASILAEGSSRLVRAAREIALTHHERWDGTGYPQGLAGEAIPLSGRIVAVADVLDALTSERPYKRAWTLDEALAEIRAQAGGQFDPRVVAALEELLREEEHGEQEAPSSWPG